MAAPGAGCAAATRGWVIVRTVAQTAFLTNGPYEAAAEMMLEPVVPRQRRPASYCAPTVAVSESRETLGEPADKQKGVER